MKIEVIEMEKGAIIRFRLSFVFILVSVALSAAPRIVVSIKPIHSLVANLTEGVTTPLLFIQSTTSPHHAMVKPSELQLLTQADLFFFVGENLEHYLSSILKKLPPTVTVVSLLEIPGLNLIHSDPHIWLDPIRMISVTQAITKKLIKIDPIHQTQYQRNAGNLQKKLQQLHEKLLIQLKPIQNQSFLTFYDAYAYLNERYHLQKGHGMVQHPEQPLGAYQLVRLKKQIDQGQFACLFQEKNFSAKTIQILNESKKIPIGTLDVFGTHLPTGPLQYFEMMSQLARTLLKGLAPPQAARSCIVPLCLLDLYSAEQICPLEHANG